MTRHWHAKRPIFEVILESTPLPVEINSRVIGDLRLEAKILLPRHSIDHVFVHWLTFTNAFITFQKLTLHPGNIL